MDPNLRRAYTSNDASGFRFEARSYSSPLFTSDGDQPGFMQNDSGSSQPRQTRPHSLFRTLTGAVNLYQELRRLRAQQLAGEQGQRQSNDRQNSARERDGAESEQQSRQRRPGYSSRERSSDAASRRRNSQPRAERQERTRERQAARLENLGHMIADNEEDIADEEHIIDQCSRWLSANGHRRNVSRRDIEGQVDRLERHKRKLKRAKESLSGLKEEQEELQRQARQQDQDVPRRRPTQRRASTQTPETADPSADMDQIFNMLFGAAAASAPFMRQRAASTDHPAFAHINMMNDFFARSANGPHFVFTTSSNPGFSRNFTEEFFATNAGPGFFPRSTRAPQFSRPAQPSVSLNLLTTAEAKTIFERYDNKWKSLGPADSAVPYPGRGLASTALLALDTIHAPLVAAPTSTWSKEDIIRANTQGLFLVAVGFTPVFNDRASRIEMDFSCGSAATTQLQALADMLKKERVRWHSDKLGRRNDGQDGPNESLQQNEIARGVFHAVCELGDLVAKKRAV